MVLDTMKDGKFIFKNTYKENKKVEIAVADSAAPDEFYFVHIGHVNYNLHWSEVLTQDNS